MVPPDQIFGSIPTWIAVYSISILCLGLSLIVFYLRVIRLILIGKTSDRNDRPFVRLIGSIPLILGQKKVLQSFSLKKDRAGLAHFVIFWGFLSFIFSYFMFIYLDLAWRPIKRFIPGGDSESPLSHHILTETGVYLYSSYIDLLATAFLIVLVWAATRRWISKPNRLMFDLTRKSESAIILLLIAALMLLTILTEALYIVSGGEGPEASVPVGATVGNLIAEFGLLSESESKLFYELSWWAHLVVILGFALYIPISKHMHIVASPLSFIFRSLEPMGTLSTPHNLESEQSFGAGMIKDFTWKELLDGYACAVCGRCTESCPANVAGKSLSPMHIVENLKEHLLEVGPSMLRDEESATPPPIIGNSIDEEALWDCLTCGLCEQVCPVGVEHIDSIIDMRRHLVMEKAKMPDTASSVLMSIEQRGHPWRGTEYNRMDWADGLELKTLADHPEADILFWVGCTAALEQRSIKVARSMVSILKRAGVDFAILGNEEICTGDPARRMGNEYLYQNLAQQNIETLKRYDVKKILTICPHCFNVMKNEYIHLGADFTVQHYTEFVSTLIEEGKIKPVATLNSTIAYHDSCYLGRHNGLYEQPRQIAKSIPGVKLVEMEHCREMGFCCGAGGGKMWMDEQQEKRVNQIRTEHFLDTEAEIVGVSCPFCLQMLEEGINSSGRAKQRQAKDLIELLDDSMGD